MGLRFCTFVPHEALEKVGPYGFFSAETRLYARLQNVPGVQSVVIGGLIDIPTMGVHRVFAIERKPWGDEYDQAMIWLAVDNAVKSFCRDLTKATV